MILETVGLVLGSLTVISGLVAIYFVSQEKAE